MQFKPRGLREAGNDKVHRLVVHQKCDLADDPAEAIEFGNQELGASLPTECQRRLGLGAVAERLATTDRLHGDSGLELRAMGAAFAYG